MIDTVRVECDEGGWRLVLEDDRFDTPLLFAVDPALLDAALVPWRDHMSEGEAVRIERFNAGAISWDEFVEQCAAADGEQAREVADWLRKRDRENAA